jgi:hypothetical protein
MERKHGIMSAEKFLIGSGYWHPSGGSKKASDFHKIWLYNITKHANGPIYTIGVDSCHPEFQHANEVFIPLIGNCGHIGDLINGNKERQICGWSASICFLALLAYNNESSFIYVEQDCLWFGDVIGQMYQDMGDRQMVFGRKMESPPWMGCAQSTFLIRHNFIPEFVSRYLALPEDRLMLPESKFTTLEEQTPEKFARLSFGVDRERPIPWESPVWYCQQWTQDELDRARERKLI